MQPFTNFAARLRRPFHRPALLFLVFAALSCPAAAQSAAAKRTFDVPAQGAERALELFSDQSGRAVIMNANPVQGFRTKSIKGEFTPLEALQLLLDGTGLVATQDDQSASLVILRQDASPDGPRAGAPATSDRPAQNDRKLAPTRPTVDKDDVLQLSPFEVTADNRGYQATTTMSGTRLNSKLEDLASAISVVTKEQMSDFALLDINDIFNYEAGTEGTGNYTELVFDTNGQPVDRTQLNPQGANRIRGVGPANTTFGNFETSGRVPIDPINIDAVEISRGPNSSIFGIGSVAGSVNSVPASANLSRDRSEIAVRADSTDGYRTSLDLNRVLKQGILAVRGSAVLQHHGFKLKPSGTDSVLLNGMVKFRPFKKTTLSGYYSHYRIEGNRPNVGMPRDGISGWQRAGRPTWDPPTVSGKLNGVTIANPAAYFHTVGQQFSQIYVDREGIADWTTGRTTSTTPANPNQTVGVRGARPDPTGFLEAQPLFQDYPVLFDQSIYDWTSVNLAAANRLRDKSATASVTLEQVFLESRRQTLALQLGWFREAAEQFARNSVGQPPGTANSVVVLQPDINERLQDGSPNPYFLRPFLGVTSPSYHDRPLDHDTYRLQLAYMLDLRSEKNRLRWLGKHQVSGYAEYKDFRSRNIEYKDAIVDRQAWIPAGLSRGNQNAAGGLGRALASGLGYFRYYVGDNSGTNVDYPTTALGFGRYTMTWGNAVTGQFNQEPVEIGTAVVTASKSDTILKSRGAILQSSLLRDRVITTFGWRYDQRSTRRRSDFKYTPDGVGIDYSDFDRWGDESWTVGEGPTSTAGVVVKPLRWFSVFANRSDSFQPQNLAYSLRLQPLPDPAGKGEDYGIALNLFDGRLVVRVNQYKTSQAHSRNGTSANLSSRILRIDYTNSPSFRSFNLQTMATEWAHAAASAQGVTLTPEALARQVAQTMQLPESFLNYAHTAFPVSATEDTVASGNEIEVHFNPTRFWTTKLNVTKQQSIFANLSPDITSWIADRLPVWQSIIDPTLGRPWFTERYNNSTSPSQFFLGDVAAPLALGKVLEGKSKPQIRKYRINASTNFRLAGISRHRILKNVNIGGALRWEDRGAIGYHGVEQLPAIVTALDPNRPVYDKARLRADILVGYRSSFLSDKVSARFQLNIRNINESGRLQPIAADPDGRRTAYRIVDPRLFIVSVTFDL